MLENDVTLTAMAETLAKSADYQILRRLVPRKTFTPSIGQSTKTGILLDVETTGLDQRKDQIIELGMVKFDYLPDGRIAGLRDVFSSFNEPSEPIPLEVTALTGNEAVGRAIAFRPQGRAQTARLQVERRERWQAEVMVHRHRGRQTGR